MVKLGNLCLYLLQKACGHFLDFLDIRFRKIVPEKHIVQRKLLVTLEALADIPLLLFIEAVGQIHQIHKGFLDGGAILLTVIIRNDLLIPLIIIDTVRIIEKQAVQFLLNQLLQILHYKVLFLHLRKFPAQQIKVDSADIKPARLFFDHKRHIVYFNILADDRIDFHHQIGCVHVTALFLQFRIDCGNGFILFPGRAGNIVTVRVFHQTDQFCGVCGERLFILDGTAHSIGGGLKQRQFHKIDCGYQISKLKVALMKENLCFFDGIKNTGNQFIFINGRIAAGCVDVSRVICQRLTERFYDADIIDNQAVALSLIHAVGTGDGLHQRVRLQRLVQIEAGKALHIKTGEPHGADEHNPERIGRILEFLVQFALFHLSPVILDIQIPFFEGLNLVLLLTYDNGHLGFMHPLQLALQFLRLLLCGRFDLRFQGFYFFFPVFLNEVIHTDAGDLVQANEHGLAACPQIGIVTDKILCDRFQTRLCRHQMDFLGELRFQLILLIDVDIGVLDSVENTVCDFRIVKVEYFFAAILIIQRNGGTVLNGAFEVVNGDIAAECTGCDIVAGQKRRAGKSDTSRCREQLHHIVGKDTILTAMRFI